MVCFGIRSSDGRYSAHMEMMNENMNNSVFSPFKGGVYRVSETLFVVQFELWYTIIWQIIGMLLICTWLILLLNGVRSESLVVLGAAYWFVLAAHNKMFYLIFKAGAKKKNGAVVEYVSQEDVIKEMV